ncbi:Transcription factor like [Actinidia chinensis var. chinensis]|uniref:Transcription factor like n=1 Tax=Actinidia chinensis var. chinensis TaxID=1590841 RepID=A0A2R6PY44_ACTCC|nr:Transcription factor like [Actinidia chinensis var. chinensis]
MVMVTENQSGNLNSAPLQFLQFPNMIVTENIVKTKFKIKIPSKRLEINPGTETCKVGQKEITNDERSRSIPAKENKKSEINKSHDLVIPSFGATKLYAAADNLKSKSSAIGSYKRKHSGGGDGQREKRRKMDRGATRQCSSILKQLMTHPGGWIFNHPVDPVKLEIPDYFSVISEPMDLGTIKTKLENNAYSSVEEFAADVRLTFSNAMEYNPPFNEVHKIAKNLNGIFSTRWNCLEAKWSQEDTNVEQGSISNGRANSINDREREKSPVHVSLLPETLMSYGEKQKLRKQLLELSTEKMSPHLQGLLKKSGFNWQREERIEVDIDAFDDETLQELKRFVRSSLGPRAAKAGSAKKTENGRRQSLGKIVHRGTDSDTRSASGSAPVNLAVNLVTPKCGSSGSMRCQCSLHCDSNRALSIDLSSERSLGQNHVDASRKNHEGRSLPASQMSKSDPESDGTVSTLDEEHCCSLPQLSTVATTASSGEDWTPPLIDIQLSPKKALRAAMLMSRFADTIFKAKQKTLLDHVDKADAVKMQKEKARLERLQREEKARIEAQIKAAEAASQMKAESELKLQRDREREAARLALQKMEKTVEIYENQEILKDLEMLSRSALSDFVLGSGEVLGSLEGFRLGNPLERLGLFMKDDYLGDDDDEVI